MSGRRLGGMRFRRGSRCVDRRIEIGTRPGTGLAGHIEGLHLGVELGDKRFHEPADEVILRGEVVEQSTLAQVCLGGHGIEGQPPRTFARNQLRGCRKN